MAGKASLIFVIGFSLIMGYIMLNLGALGTRATANVAWYNSAANSKNLATMGANIALAKLTNPDAYGLSAPVSSQVLASQVFTEGPFSGGRFDAYWNSDTRILRSVSVSQNHTGGQIRDTVEIGFDFRVDMENSFTVFAYMTNFEASNIFWVTGEKIYGRLHSNTNLSVSGRPDFHGKVTVAGNFRPPPGETAWLEGAWRTNNGRYHGGFESGVDVIPWPHDLSYTNNAAKIGGRYYEDFEGVPLDEVWIQLEPGTLAPNDGIALVRRVNTGAGGLKTPGEIIDTVHIGHYGFNGVLAAKGRIYLEGTLSGQLTISSTENDIYIADNVTYQNSLALNVFDEEINTNIHMVQGDDMLGLVAHGAVRIKEKKSNGQNFMDPQIHASIFAYGHGFGAENYDSGADRGEVFVLGSLIQERRNAVGRIAGGVKTGYHKHYMYDTRLRDLNVRPPFFPGFWDPTDGKLKIVNWYESIQLPNY